MADILYGDTDPYGSSDTDDYESDSGNADNDLGPLEKLDKYISCEHSYNRQMVVRSLPETITQIANLAQPVQKVFDAIVHLSNDSDEAVRMELVEQLPVIAEQCQRYPQLSELNGVSTYMLPIIVKYLSDSCTQVRKATHSTLLRLADQCLTHGDIEQQVLPVLLTLTDPDSIDDFRTEAVMLMSRLAIIVGKDVTERLLLPRFAEMCTDALFHVRKACASNFGEMCKIVGQENTETYLLPKFYYLCEDGVWGVRNACAECFVQVSMVCSLQVRRSDLTQLFIDLICDQSRWVRLAAFQSLGAFIATFADPTLTGLSLTDDGCVVYTESAITRSVSNSAVSKGGISPTAVGSDKDNGVVEQPVGKKTQLTDKLDASGHLARDDSFNSFQFWRITPSMINEQLLTTTLNNSTSSCVQEVVHEVTDSHPTCGIDVLQTAEVSVNSCHLNLSDLDSTADSTCADQQTIVPQELLNHYLSMTEPSRAQTVDSEIMRHCAFNFPAVAYTLGRSNWSYLRNLYNILARDMQWKVRRTLAFSIHQLAVILGEDLTITELVPVFDEFLKDLDEVRVGILKHLADFLRLLKMDVRRLYLTKLPEFLKTDNSRNWRLRLDLTEQLVLLVDIFSPADVHDFLLPIVFSLAYDGVSEVRIAAVKVLSQALKHVQSDDALFVQLTTTIKERFVDHHLSSYRLMFLRLCNQILNDQSIPVEVFAAYFLPHALTASSDTVPNIRIFLARLLCRHLLTSAYFTSENNPSYSNLMAVVDQLTSDKDRDVQNVMKGSSS
jgi:serine/threonine-protein phosphatase 4 regulatory subunit 1